MRCGLLVVGLMPLGSLLVPARALADDLTGLHAVQVVVESLDSDATSGGLDAEVLRTDVELRLRQNRLSVVGKDPSADQPFLFGHVPYQGQWPVRFLGGVVTAGKCEANSETRQSHPRSRHVGQGDAWD